MKTCSIDTVQSEVLNVVKNYKHFRVSSDALTCMHRVLSFLNSKGQTVLATMKEPSNKLLLHAAAQAFDEEQLELEDTTSWTNQSSDEFLHTVTVHSAKKNKTWMKTLNPYFSPSDEDIPLRPLEEKFIVTSIRVLICYLTLNNL